MVSREPELAAAEAWLNHDTERTALVIEGEPGIGKTTIWSAAIARAAKRGWTVLSCRPRASDRSLSYVGLTDLFSPLSEESLASLSPPQRKALDVALLKRESDAGELEPRAVGTAVLSLLRDIARPPGLLLAVDDAQWLDRATARALAFALHRLADHPLKLVAAVRVEAGLEARAAPLELLATTLGNDRWKRLRVGPLSAAAIHRVLLQGLGRSFTRPLVVRIHKDSGGNPFYALEIARELLHAGVPPPGGPLPVPQSHRDVALLRLQRLPRATRGALAQVAAMSRPTTARVNLKDLAPAERAGIVRILDDGTVDFTHPLFGSALYASLPEQDRRDLHRSLAALEVGLEERARHLALAAAGPDEETAQALDRAARAAGTRGAADAAVELRSLALRMTPDSDAGAVASRRLELALTMYFAGDPASARRELEKSVADLPRGEERAKALLELGSVVWNQKNEGQAGYQRMREALDQAQTPGLRARIHSRIASMIEDYEIAAEHAERAVALIDEEKEPLLYSFALHNLARAKFALGRGADHAAIEKGLRMQRESARWEVSTMPAFWALYMDQFETARARFRELLRVFREQGDEASCSGILAQLTYVELLTGHFETAAEYATGAHGLAEETEQDLWINVALVATGRVNAYAGRLDAAREAATTLLGRLAAQPDSHIECMANGLLGFVAFTAGDYAEAVSRFSRVDELLDSYHMREPAPDRIHGDFAEAAIALGDLEGAEAIVQRMEARARAVPRPWVSEVGARARGLLHAARGDLDAAVTSLQSALEHDKDLGMPLEGARSRLALGQVLRRRKQRRQARAEILEALTTFERLGAGIWAERARAELARLPVRRAPAELTPAEETIARLAASGLTNREVADRAFVSAKTVEANLARVYAKLGVHSRAELGRAMAERPVALNT